MGEQNRASSGAAGRAHCLDCGVRIATDPYCPDCRGSEANP